MRVNNLLHILLLSGLILFAMTASAGAELATLSSGPATLSWQILKSHEGLSLTVSGPEDLMIKDTFGPGENATFSIFDDEGNVFPDGSYSWELRATAALDEALAKLDRSLTTNLRGGEGQVMSGVFSIVDGQLLVAEEIVEAKAAPGADRDGGIQTKDQQILDDLIVDGSACIGQDCVNGESFGFDTIRLKENNLRIKFQDTSNSASFPTNDWQITANDSSNGGANKFSIDDIDGGRTPFTIEASAPSNSLYVEADGDIGFGTKDPVVNLHVVDGNTPTLRLEQDGSSGFTPQTWDVAGNEANFFVRDATNGSKLPLKIKPSAPTGAIFVAADGDIGMGTESPSGDLHIRDTGSGNNADLLMEANGNTWRFRTNNSNGRLSVANSGGSGNTAILIDPGVNDNVLRIGLDDTNTAVANQVTVDGNLLVTGTCTGCDAVFSPGYPVESIEEHAAFMWENSYLPGVGATQEGKTAINVFQKVTGILQELEKAHIYIEQLNGELAEVKAELAEVKGN